MKKRYDMIQVVILLAFLVLAVLLDNAVINGLTLFLFSAALIVNTLWKLLTMKEEGFVRQLLYGILLFIEILLAIGAVLAVVTAIMGV